MAKATCSIDGCENSDKLRRSWCCSHYMRWYRNGDPLGTRAMNGEPLAYFEAHIGDKRNVECWLWPYTRITGGYGTLTLDGKAAHVHVLACARVNGPRPDGMEACHSCGKGHLGCWNPWHLRWDTRAANAREGLGTRLTMADANEIRDRYAFGGITQKNLGAEYGISRRQVGRIVDGQRWA